MKVTVGIPSFNAERWIAQAVQSALDQQGVEIEVIVVDDGSTDGSVAVAQKFGARVKIIEGGHQGANHARNLVLQNATGEWVQYLDADDYLEPAKIITQLRESNDGRDADVLHSPVWVETWKAESSSRVASESSPDADIFTQWIRWHIPQTGGCLWRREALVRAGGWKEGQPCCQEHELYLRALMTGLRFAFTPTPGAVYRIWSEETLCRKDPLLVIRVRTGLFDTLLAHLTEKGILTGMHRRELGRACFEMSRTFAKHDLPDAAAYHAGQKAKGLIHPAGPAAPHSYRVIYSLLGFTAAERVARWMR
ncbi:MAG: glycosyltransferase [Chthoniobacteraceae bacterium]